MRQRKQTYYMADFETTVYDNQEFTEVWLAGRCELYTEEAVITHSIDDWFDDILSLDKNCTIFFHNVKFDGSFIIDFLKKQKSWTEALIVEKDGRKHFKTEKELDHREYTYLISDKGVFYNIVLCYHKKIYRIIDSYKLLPMSLEVLGKAFETKHQKLSMEYEGYRYAHCDATPEQMEYMKNDLYVGKECLEYMFDRNHKKSTIGSCCINEFKKLYDKEDYKTLFPNLYDINLPPELIDINNPNAGEYINHSYHGAWVYCDDRYKDKIQYKGITVDANSLYPSVMHSKSGIYYPVGNPTFWEGDMPPECESSKYYFINITCSFELKPKHLPFIQIKNDIRYYGRTMLKSSKPNRDGAIGSDTVTMTMTCSDYELFLKHYNVKNLTVNSGCYFNKMIGIFDKYIDKYFEIKKNAKTKADRQIAKLFLNNLYGRFAMYVDSSFKICHLNNGVITFESVKEREKIPGYIAIGSAIISYARCETITKAQLNYDRFCYADTDSLHCIGQEPLNGVPIHDTELGYWKEELKWERAFFHRAKTYIETEKIDNKEKYHITCAGLGKKAKGILEMAFEYRDGTLKEVPENLTQNQVDFIRQGKDLSDFKKGLRVSGNLKPKRIIGGIILVEKTFDMRF